MEPEGADYVCPGCSQTVHVLPAAQAQLYACPACGNEFIVAGQDGSTDLPSDEPVVEVRDRSAELDNVRIRQLSQAKRAANRARSFCLIGMLFSIVGTVQLIIRVISDGVHHRAGLLTGIYALVAIVLATLAVILYRKSRGFAAEARRSTLHPPDHPPDFTTLGDGSQRWRDLEKL